MHISYVTGGARSGKSHFAEALALRQSEAPVYLATSVRWDDDHAARIAHHQARRDARWTTVESPLDLALPALAGRVVLLDCLTLWLTNLFDESAYDSAKAEAEALRRWAAWLALPVAQQPERLIVVSNELGMGLHAETAAGRAFVDAHGRLNQRVAGDAHEAWLLVSGLPLQLKSTDITL